MAKNIPAKEFKAAVKSLNTQLEADDAAKIRLVGVKKEAVYKEFTETIQKYIDDDRTTDLPDDVIEFYNTHVVGGEEEEEGADVAAAASEEKAGKKDTKKGAKKTGKKSTKKDTKSTGKKDTKKGAKKEAAPGPKKETKKAVCIELLERKGGATLQEMGEEITKRGIDDDTAKNARTAGLWMRKIGFAVEKLEDGKWQKAAK